jgi:hypothetical protein
MPVQGSVPLPPYHPLVFACFLASVHFENKQKEQTLHAKSRKQEMREIKVVALFGTWIHLKSEETKKTSFQMCFTQYSLTASESQQL